MKESKSYKFDLQHSPNNANICVTHVTWLQLINKSFNISKKHFFMYETLSLAKASITSYLIW